MSVGIIMLVHTALERAKQVARHWAKGGCPVVIHVDTNVENDIYNEFVLSLSDVPDLEFSKRYRCEWGTWGLVAASLAASEQMLARFPDVKHVYLSSGSCLPLRPVQELVSYLEQRPETDFIESATTADVPWTVGGLDQERFILHFPFSWRRHRLLFDRYVDLQRALRIKRRIPKGIVPHMGSQWWCLTRNTLSSILNAPERQNNDGYFRKVWIPDESYFQTLARQFSENIESRSLTLSKFDFQGKPHVFYDDHLQLLRRSDCFVARKIWPQAERLYDVFLNNTPTKTRRTEPNPGKIDRVFAKAVERRTRGRPGLYMQSRFPNPDWENGVTAAPYSIFHGFAELFEDFEEWLAKATKTQVHGHIFAPDRAYFSGGRKTIEGALSDSAKARDYNPKAFFTNLIWNTRGQRQCFQFGPADTQDLNWFFAKDNNAQISVITGAWSIPLFKSDKDFTAIRKEAARLQRIENEHLKILRSPFARARIHIWSMAEFIEAPMEPLQGILDEIGVDYRYGILNSPDLVDLKGFGQFLQKLKNQGMHPYLMGDFSLERIGDAPVASVRKSYMVR